MTLSLHGSGANNFMSVGPQVLALLSGNLLSPNLGYLFLSFYLLKKYISHISEIIQYSSL